MNSAGGERGALPDLTWAALLAHWTGFAKAVAALPRDDASEAWRRAAPSVIALQAVCMALDRLESIAVGDLGAAEYAVGVDRAAVMIREHAAVVNAAWRGQELPGGVLELLSDARSTLARVREAGTEVVLADGADGVPAFGEPNALASALLEAGFAGDAYVMLAPAELVIPPGTPVAFVRERSGRPLSAAAGAAVRAWAGAATVVRAPVMRQVYLCPSPSGPTVEVRTMDAELAPGRPLLMPVIHAGLAVE